jgi:hypothetical protein
VSLMSKKLGRLFLYYGVGSRGNARAGGKRKGGERGSQPKSKRNKYVQHDDISRLIKEDEAHSIDSTANSLRARLHCWHENAKQAIERRLAELYLFSASRKPGQPAWLTLTLIALPLQNPMLPSASKNPQSARSSAAAAEIVARLLPHAFGPKRDQLLLAWQHLGADADRKKNLPKRAQQMKDLKRK